MNLNVYCIEPVPASERLDGDAVITMRRGAVLRTACGAHHRLARAFVASDLPRLRRYVRRLRRWTGAQRITVAGYCQREYLTEDGAIIEPLPDDRRDTPSGTAPLLAAHKGE